MISSTINNESVLTYIPNIDVCRGFLKNFGQRYGNGTKGSSVGQISYRLCGLLSNYELDSYTRSN